MSRDVQIAKREIYIALDNLPPEAVVEVADFVKQLKVKSTKSPISLHGIWKDIPFDVDNRTIRKLRRRLSRQVLKRKI